MAQNYVSAHMWMNLVGYEGGLKTRQKAVCPHRENCRRHRSQKRRGSRACRTITLVSQSDGRAVLVGPVKPGFSVGEPTDRARVTESGRRRGQHGFGNCVGKRNVTSDTQSDVQYPHPKWNAYLYIRQSSPREVFENIERKTSIRFAPTP